MNHMKKQNSALSDPFPSLGDLLKNWFGVEGSWLKCSTFNSTNVTNYTVCILLVSQDFFFLYYQVYKWASNKNNDD